MARKYALFVGNSEYDSESLVNLDAPIADVQDLASIFRDTAIGGFDEVIELINSTESEIRQKISSFFLQKKPEDLLLLYFSGHGVLDDRGHLYLAVKDTQPNLLRATAISADFIADDMDLCRSKRQILILDCCHSGAFRRGIKADDQVLTASTFEGNGSGRIVLTASDRREFAMEGNQVLDKANTSLFTHFLLEGIKSGNADRDGDSLITLDEWYDYAYEKVVENLPSQTPRRWVYNQEGKLIIARNPCPVEQADLTKELREAIADEDPSIRLKAIPRLADILHGPDRRLVFAAREALENLQEDERIEVREAAKRILRGIKSAFPVVSAETEAPSRKRNLAVIKNYKDYWRTWSLAATIALSAGAIGWALYPPSGSNNLTDGKEPASTEQPDNQVAGISGGDIGLPPEKHAGEENKDEQQTTPVLKDDSPEEQQTTSPNKEPSDSPGGDQTGENLKNDDEKFTDKTVVGTAGNGQNTSTNPSSGNNSPPENDGGPTEPEKNTAEEDPSNTEERPIDRLQSEITGVQISLRQAIMEGDFSGLPAPVANYYEGKLKGLYTKFNVVEVELVNGELEGDDPTFTMKVTAQIRYLQKGRDHPVNEIPIPAASWVWTNGGHGFVLSSVQ